MSSLVLTSLGATLVVLGVVGTPAHLLAARRATPYHLGLAALGGGLLVLGLIGLVGAMTAGV
ncbi:MAG: hypothetical protein ACXWW9_07035 [Actinomycetota bacterium]